MKKLSFLKSTFSLVLVLTMSILLVNCSSSSDDDEDYVPSTGNAFNLADFTLTVTSKKLVADWLQIDYTIKNTSKISYTKGEQGNFTVKFTAKTTDGEIFQRTTYVQYVEAGVTYTDDVHLNYPVGKTLDLSTLTAVIVKD
ncbi:hypothetical protein FLA105534_01787 [Flavobacterium bizetiae]|uniref:Uncharacterized protein n=1 Tax=Flavobacterium bizetiae TaxID=2704140 RepID=A0A6J4GJQ5_9FLAO|nr:hypothetical protein [Flavobacterium bizetiae]CAA9197736.1 hypothetical protein FLA105534_01787 [Flavobacterium bizetiae]CAD5344260.1 hypothetical protein FLA105535_04266 [Flavobacterium bizetiae]CAD5348668.1 hypothetical protein FLA105534_02635 [Flavobacterium bizetiae]